LSSKEEGGSAGRRDSPSPIWLSILAGGCFLSVCLNVLLLGVAWPRLAGRSEQSGLELVSPRLELQIASLQVQPRSLDAALVSSILAQPQETWPTPAGSHPAPVEPSSARSLAEDGHESHPHDALIFLFIAMLVGTLVLQATMHRKLENLQQTVTLFIIGIVYSLVFKGLELREDAGVVGVSYDMWIGIDPHLILFTMLPALLAGDAMSADTTVVKRVAGQCMYLAGPGLIASTLLSALFLKAYLAQYNWSFELALTLGAILAATDPVAVVNLLKQLGAPPALTVRIQGESLLNDGTAIVLFTMAYDMLKGVEYEVADVIIFVVRKAICPAGLGWVIGWVFVLWINAAGNRFQHNSSTIQICLTLCCAYWSFIIAEGVLDMSGVLCTVAASLVMADNMWASIVEKQTLGHVWHIVEFLGNTVIFFLAGALTGDTMLHVAWQDYGHLLVIYVVLTFIRGFVIFVSLPILAKLSTGAAKHPHADRQHKQIQKLEFAEAIVLTWGGLRGAVGLALAMQVRQDRANGTLDIDDARRVLFYTGGIAFLTLVINATTCPFLVKFLGLVQTDSTKRRLLLGLYQQMLHKVEEENAKGSMNSLLKDMMEEISQKISAAKAISSSHSIEPVHIRGGPSQSHHSGMHPESSGEQSHTLGAVESHAMQATVSMASYRVEAMKSMALIKRALTRKIEAATDGAILVRDYQKAYRRLRNVIPEKLLFLNVPDLGKLQVQPVMLRIATREAPEVNMLRLINEAFLNMVRHEYWRQIEAGDFIDGSSQPDRLLNSVAFAMQSDSTELADFDFLVREMGWSDKEMNLEEMEVSPSPENKNGMSGEDKFNDGGASPDSNNKEGRPTLTLGPAIVTRRSSAASQALQMSAVISMVEENTLGHNCPTRIIKSTIFNFFITLAILLNVIQIFVEDQVRDTDDNDVGIWLAVEVVFILVFTAECLLKLAALRKAYFSDAWNVFDFTLLVLGYIGLSADIAAASGNSANVSSEARVFRINRIFRVMRLMRVFRLVKFVQVLRARFSGREISVELAKSMRSISMLSAFARAHILAQERLQVYFGEASGLQGVELSRCMIDSSTAVCQAICLAASEVHSLEFTILRSLATLRESSRVTEELTSFIIEAADIGVMNAIEASSLLQPLRDYSQKWYMQAQEQEMGIMSPFSPKSMTEETQWSAAEHVTAIASPDDLKSKDIHPPKGESPVVMERVRMGGKDGDSQSEESSFRSRHSRRPSQKLIPQHSNILSDENGYGCTEEPCTASDKLDESYHALNMPPPPNARDWFEPVEPPGLPNQPADLSK